MWHRCACWRCASSGVEAQHAAPPALALADHDLLDLQPLADRAAAACTRGHLLGQRLEVGRPDHARVTDEQTARESPVAQVALDLRHRGDVQRVAREYRLDSPRLRGAR